MLGLAGKIIAAVIVAGMFGFGAGKGALAIFIRLLLAAAFALAALSFAFHLIKAPFGMAARAIAKKAPAAIPDVRGRSLPARRGARGPSACGA